MYGHDDRAVRAYSTGGRAHPYARERDEAPRSSGCRVFVHNLAFSTSWQDLKDHARQAGEVVHAKILEEPSGRSKGMGVVEFASRAEAQDAVRVLDETELDGRQISVREDRDPPSAGGGDRDRERGDVRAELRGPRGGDVQTCHNCGGLGHLSRDCPSEPGIGGGGAGGRAPRARALPPLRSEREPPARGPVMSGACNKCGKEGHWARECPSAGGGGGRGGGGRGGGRGGRPQVDGAALDADMDAYFAGK